MAKPDFKKFSKQVCDAMLIAPKENPGIKKAEKKYGRFINKLLKKKFINLKDFTKAEQKKIKDLQKFKYGPLIARLESRLIIKRKVGEVVRITYTEADKDAIRLAKLIREECWKRGCVAALIPGSQVDARKSLKLTPKATLVEGSPLAEAITKNIDVSIFIGYIEDRNWSKGFEKELKLCAPWGMHIHQILDKRKVRWCFLGLPVRMKKRDYIMPKRLYNKTFYESLFETYTKTTQRLTEYYEIALKGGDKIRLTAKDGTDLTFSIKDRPVLPSLGFMTKEKIKKGDVGLNIPDGEVFIAPLEHSANGKILFDNVLPEGFGLIENLWAYFENGKIVKFSADGDGANKFEKFLDSNTGEKDRIAELGIGTNKKARFIGAILIDEKIYGTVHIAIGNNTGAYHGKNVASSHLDMIKQMKGKGGNLYVDGILVMKNGEPAT